MAKILKTLSPVDSMSGMIGRRDETVSNKAFIINVRKIGGVQHKGAPFMYFSVRANDRKTPMSSSEVAHQRKFAAVVAATRERLVDATWVDKDMVDFSKQTKYPTIYGYVFKQVWDAYEG